MFHKHFFFVNWETLTINFVLVTIIRELSIGLSCFCEVYNVTDTIFNTCILDDLYVCSLWDVTRNKSGKLLLIQLVPSKVKMKLLKLEIGMCMESNLTFQRKRFGFVRRIIIFCHPPPHSILSRWLKCMVSDNASQNSYKIPLGYGDNFPANIFFIRVMYKTETFCWFYNIYRVRL